MRDCVRQPHMQPGPPLDAPFIQKLHSHPILGKYLLWSKIAEGGYGLVYIGASASSSVEKRLLNLSAPARDAGNKQEVALKLEHKDITPSHLDHEFDNLQMMQGVVGFPRVLAQGELGEYRILALELLGPSIYDLFVFCSRRFSLETTVGIGLGVLDRLKDMHKRGLVHGDLKPSNLLIGTGRNGNTVYVVDLGLTVDFDFNGVTSIRPRTLQKDYWGTPMFVSLDTHYGSAARPRDDLESLGYVLALLLQGDLPWSAQASGEVVHNQRFVDLKQEAILFTHETLFPRALKPYFDVLAKMDRHQMPDYDALRSALTGLVAFDQPHIWDWTIVWDQENRSQQA